MWLEFTDVRYNLLNPKNTIIILWVSNLRFYIQHARQHLFLNLVMLNGLINTNMRQSGKQCITNYGTLSVPLTLQS